MAKQTGQARRAVIYVRISKDRDNETSTTTQRAEAEQYAKRKGWQVVGVEKDEGRSAFKANVKRPGFDKALRMIETGAADILIVWRLDRFARGIVSFWDSWRRIDAAGGELVSVTEDLDTTKVVGKILVGLIAGFAEMESEAKSERISSWHDHRRANGNIPTGPRPYGYDRAAGALTINEVEAAEIRKAVDDLLSGVSSYAIVQGMCERGTTTSHGNPWTRRGLGQLLRSPTIAGLRADGAGGVLPGQWEPIIAPAAWRQVQTILDDPARRSSPSSSARRWLLSGFGTCGACGGLLTSKSHAAGTRYICRVCGVGAPAEPVDELVGATVVALVDRKAWDKLRAAGRAPGVDLDALENELVELAEMHRAGELTLAEWKVMRSGIAERAADADLEPVELPAVDDLATAWPTLTVEARQLVLAAVTQSITIGPVTQHRNRFDPERVSIDWRV